MSERAATPASILLVDDDETLLQLLGSVLEAEGYETVATRSAEEALAMLERRQFQLVLTDLRMPGMSGLDLLGEVKRGNSELPVIIATGHASIDSAVEAMRAGAADYVSKPLSDEDLRLKVRRVLRFRRLEVENRWLHQELAASWRPGRIVAVSSKMRSIVEMVEKLAQSDSTVLLSGESGTGKEVLARALHYGGPRSSGPFVALNCAAIPAGLVESELFGHARGAFTHAVRDAVGKLELAHGGTLFLDEIGELPLEMQPKLLRVVQERAFERVGEQRLRHVDVRLVSATNRDLKQLAREGKFREDLYYRLAVVLIHIPPLHERPEDIPPLVTFLLHRLAGDEAPVVLDEAMEALQRRRWPGNVRELANVLERALALNDSGVLTLQDLPSPESSDAGAPASAAPPASPQGTRLVALPPEGAPLDAMIRDLLVQALERRNWNQSAAARLLRIPRHILQYRMMKYGIVPPGRRED